MKKLGRFFLLSAAMSIFTGCGMLEKKVSAFERKTLSLPGMAFIANPMEESSMQHMFNAREGSVGGFGGAGGGCGCN